jgi:hypothetical protein
VFSSVLFLNSRLEKNHMVSCGVVVTFLGWHDVRDDSCYDMVFESQKSMSLCVGMSHLGRFLA